MAKESYGNSLFTPKNILLYLVVGGVIYALIYYVFLAGKNGNNYSPTSQTTPSGNVGSMAKAMTVYLYALNNSKETGTAVLSDQNGKTKVVLTLANEPTRASEPAHIHLGACPNPGAVKYPLSNVVGGTSETVLDVSMDTLKASLPLAVNVHKSAALIKTYVSCGDLK